MVDPDQPQLNCPWCGQSLRGLEPLGPAQVLRCPECGGVTSIARLAEHFGHARAARRRLPMMIGLAMLVVWTIGSVLARQPHLAVRNDAILALCFMIGAIITGWFTILWHEPPAGTRLLAMMSGGAVAALTARIFGDFVAPLAVIAWIFGLHRWAIARGYA